MAHILRRKTHRKQSSKSTENELHASPSKINEKKKAHLWRVIAPFVTVPKKITEVEDEQFSFYLKKKPAVLLRDLSTFMSDSVDLPSLFHETADVLKKVTKASWVTLYLVDTAANEIYISTPTPTSERHKVKWRIDEKSIVATYVADKKEYVILEDVLLDLRFPEGIGYDGNVIPKSVMCIPVVTPAGDCFAVIELVRTVNRTAFGQDDMRICVMVTAWMGVAIHQNQERLALKRQQELNDYLLDLIKCYFEDHVLMEKLMSEVVKFAKITLGAERGSFFIIDQDNDEMIAHLFDESSESTSESNKIKKVRFAKERGIAGLVARTGITVNIKDAYKDSRFNKDIDQKTGFITRSILCMPIVGAAGILGVVQVVNKKNGGCFTSADETLFKTFSLYCSLAVHYTNIHSEINKQKHLNIINLRGVKLQQVPCIHDQTFLTTAATSAKIPRDFDSFSWYINNTDELTVAPQYILHMMFQLIPHSEIHLDNMIKFILTVRKFYRDIPYHSFEHAFNVCHCVYAILKRNVLKFTKLEIKAFLVACICHDIDHVGLTNNFLQMIKHDLAVLYESSVMESHHCHITLMLLKDHEIFNNFTDTIRDLFNKEVTRLILDTDLALYFESKVRLVKIYNSKSFNWNNPTHRTLAKALIMTSCDLSGMGKPFLAAKRICDNLYREFYRQGDIEKSLGLCPLSVMDRDKEYFVPEDQIRFLDVVAIPCFEILKVLLPNTRELYDGSIILRTTWQDIIDTRRTKIWRQDDSIVRKYI